MTLKTPTLLLSVFLLAGCSAFNPRFLTVASLPYTNGGETPRQQCVLYHAHGLTQSPDNCVIDLTQEQRQSVDFIAKRNALQDDLITQSNLQCDRLTGNLQNMPRSTRLGLGIGAAILAAAATSSSARSSSSESSDGSGDDDDKSSRTAGLAAGAAVFASVDQLLRESFPNDAQSIIRGIEYSQAQAKFRMANESTSDLNAYSVQAAVRDSMEYHRLCSVARGREATSQVLNQALQQLGN